MPVRFVGAKRAPGVWQRIISLFPPHATFVEAFGGTAHIARTKKPAPVSTIVIDADPAAPCMAMADPIVWPGGAARLAAGGERRHQITAAGGVAGLGDPIVIHGDARCVLPRLPLGASDLVYADPPYPASVRRAPRRYYAHELMTDEEHAGLLSLLLALPCMVAVSGYRCALYDSTLAGWSLEEIPTVTRGGGRSTECVWFNWPRQEPADVRFVGENFRDRERIKRKAARWARMLKAMPPHERAAVLAAVNDAR